MASIAELLELPEVSVQSITDISARLLVGVPEEALGLARINVKGFSRTHMMKLVAMGYGDVDSLRSLTVQKLEGILPKKVGKRLVSFLDSEPLKTDPEAAAPEAPKSNEEPPPAESPLCTRPVRIHFHGEVDKRRTILSIDGISRPVPNKTFALLLRLGLQLLKDHVGWVPKEDLTEGNVMQAISRARKELESFGIRNPLDLLENDRFGSYRLAISLENVSFDVEKITSHWDYTISRFAEELCAVTSA